MHTQYVHTNAYSLINRGCATFFSWENWHNLMAYVVVRSFVRMRMPWADKNEHKGLFKRSVLKLIIEEKMR